MGPIEAYIFQVINGVLKGYEYAEIKRRIERLEKIFEDELGKKAEKTGEEI